MAKFTVVGGEASSDLAKRIARKIKSPYIKTEKKVFPDGESKITINQIPKKSIVVVVQSTYPPVDSNLLELLSICLLYTSPSPRDLSTSRMPSSA